MSWHLIGEKRKRDTRGVFPFDYISICLSIDAKVGDIRDDEDDGFLGCDGGYVCLIYRGILRGSAGAVDITEGDTPATVEVEILIEHVIVVSGEEYVALGDIESSAILTMRIYNTVGAAGNLCTVVISRAADINLVVGI